MAFHLAITVVYETGIARLAREAPPLWLLGGSLCVVAGTVAASQWLLTRFYPAAR